MDVQKTIDLFNQVLKDYETVETYNIFFYSTNFNRDFNLLKTKVSDYRKKLDKIITDGAKHTQQAGITAGEKDIQAELL